MSDSMRTTSASPKHGASAARRDAAAANPLTDAKKMGNELVGAVRESAMTMLDDQRSRAADQIASVGEALRRSAQSFEDAGGETVVRYADQAGRQITDFADNLRNRTWGELGNDVEDFARRWPLAFMTGAIGIGFLAGRFWMSSAEHAAGHRGSGTQIVKTGSETHGAMPRRSIGTPVGGAKPGSGAASTRE